MNNIQTQLWAITILFSVGFFDGALTLGIPDGVYTLVGLAMIGTLVWMWVDYNKTKNA